MTCVGNLARREYVVGRASELDGKDFLVHQVHVVLASKVQHLKRKRKS